MIEGRRALGWRGVFLLALLLSPALPATPQPVSPGRIDVAAPVAELCPSFDFAAFEGSSGYQLAIYDLGPDGTADPALVTQVDLPAGASGWTPSADRCLEPNRQYAWAVRALGQRGAGEWSEIATFRTPENAFTESQIEDIRARVREELRLATGESTDTSLQSPTPLLQGTPSGDGSAPDLATVKSGLRSMPSETSGEVAGVVGVSQSPDGAGMIAANTNPGGADLVLEGQSHGAADTVMTESGIDVGGETFSISGQPGLTVLIDGSEAVTSETIVEHDTLGMLDCAANQVAQWDGAQWVCKTLMLGDIEIPAPEAPQYVRVVPNYLDPSTQRLAWSMDDLTGVANFIVYQSPSPITEANKGSATRRVTSEMWVPINVIPDSGLMHFRVEAVNIQGEAGELSREYVLDSRVRAEVSVGELMFPPMEVERFLATTSGELTQFITDPPSIVGGRWSPGGTEFAFMQEDALYVATRSGETRQVAQAPADERMIQLSVSLWAPDSKRLVYGLLDGFNDLTAEVFVVDSDGSNQTFLYEASWQGFTLWSPSGDRIAYTDSEGVGEPFSKLYVVSSSGGASELVFERRFTRMGWAPNGRHLAVSTINDSNRKLWVVTADGSTATDMTEDLDSLVGTLFAWSPDGSRIAFIGLDNDSLFQGLYVSPAMPASPVRVNRPVGNGAMVIGGDPFQWAPDGTTIAYVADENVPEQLDLFLVSVDGSNVVQVSIDPRNTGADIESFTWSADGAWIAYLVDEKWEFSEELFIWSRETGQSKRVHQPISQGDSVVNRPSFSPSSDFVTYILFEQGRGVDCYIAPTRTGHPIKVNPDNRDTRFVRWIPQGWLPRPTGTGV